MLFYVKILDPSQLKIASKNGRQIDDFWLKIVKNRKNRDLTPIFSGYFQLARIQNFNVKKALEKSFPELVYPPLSQNKKAILANRTKLVKKQCFWPLFDL